ncbi:MAG: M20/M25/M40 family metallo-hydrolase [Acidobacteria bacterium]|nr:M20/M25/M40 family metallo-hydrolase [Acidobacteriota bacterium]
MSPLALIVSAFLLLAAQVPVPPGRPGDRNSQETQGAPDPPFQGDCARLAREIAQGRAMADLEELCDDIGPRLTGSEKLRQAQAWAVAKLWAYGAVNVHEEAAEFPRSWTRGPARARLLNANGQELRVAQAAWSPATEGPVQGEVALLEAKTLAELKSKIPALAGKVVLVGAVPRPAPGEDRSTYFRDLMAAFSGAEFKVALTDSAKKGELLGMRGSPAGGRGSKAPAAYITTEHANLLRRLVARGRHPLVEVELGGKLGKDPVTVYNVVGEIPGTEAGREVVILGGHLDSWDLGTGATDNGTGSVACLEALRAVKALGLKPKRTLRVVLFFGEEQGLLGARAYVQAHERELKDIQAVLIHDMGSGRIKGWPSMGQEAWIPLLGRAMAPANALGCQEISPFTVPGNTDHWPFFLKGVPAFPATQDPLDYFSATHHTQVDTFDHVVKDDFLQSCQALALTAWGLLQMPERLPHAAPREDRRPGPP